MKHENEIKKMMKMREIQYRGDYYYFISFILFHNNKNENYALSRTYKKFVLFINVINKLKYFNVTCLPLITTPIVQPINNKVKGR